ncbi:MAG TPA: TetR/AcrR family transcriptional regulator [Nannocystaceae bacterium]|nr:TetR/AcrR family transcriptional regulator [Nannocystaceae bacterium]
MARRSAAAPTRARAKASDPDSTRTSILDAALELFVERGFHGTAVPLVAERAGIAAGTIYRHFESKEALVNALYRTWKERISAHVLRDFPMTATPREQFHHTWVNLTEFVAEHPRAYAFLELHHHAPYLDEGSRAVERRTYDFASVVIARGQAIGVVRAGAAPVLLSLLHGAFVGLVRFWRDGRVAWTPEELELAESACWDLLHAR